MLSHSFDMFVAHSMPQLFQDFNIQSPSEASKLALQTMIHLLLELASLLITHNLVSESNAFLVFCRPTHAHFVILLALLWSLSWLSHPQVCQTLVFTSDNVWASVFSHSCLETPSETIPLVITQDSCICLWCGNICSAATLLLLAGKNEPIHWCHSS